METLELLEELLGEYPGTLLLVSHDRDFLDSVVTSTLVMEGDGRVGDYVGGYSDWLRQRPTRGESARATAAAAPKEKAIETPVSAATPAAKRKLSYKDQRDLELLPQQIEAFETKLAIMTAAMHDPAFYQRDHASVTAHNAELAATQTALEQAYARWEALDG